MPGSQHPSKAGLSLLLQLGINYSDRGGVLSVDLEKGALKMGYDLQRKARGACRQAVVITIMNHCVAALISEQVGTLYQKLQN